MAFDFITGAEDLIKTVVNKFFPDKTEQEKNKFELMAQELRQGFQELADQRDINKEEAKSQSVFVAGWRPFIGWVCGSAFAWNFVIGPIAEWIATLFGYKTDIPPLDSSLMMPVLLGMLGLGGLRTFEKTRNGK